MHGFRENYRENAEPLTITRDSFQVAPSIKVFINY